VIGRGGRGSDYFDDLPDVLAALRAKGNRVRVLFLDASDEVLLRRYEGTRRRHPLAARGVEESIADERRLLAPVRDQADLLIDTGELNTNQLRSRVLDAFGGEGGTSSMRTSVVSFGYKYGLPLDVDLVFDCRFLPNPFWIEELRPHSGLDGPVRDYVLSQPETKDFLGTWIGDRRSRGGGARRRARHRGHIARRPSLRGRAHRGGLGGRRRRVQRPPAGDPQRGGAGRSAQVPGGAGGR
jgi:UPF0042 nucleotide-binding protein